MSLCRRLSRTALTAVGAAVLGAAVLGAAALGAAQAGTAQVGTAQLGATVPLTAVPGGPDVVTPASVGLSSPSGTWEDPLTATVDGSCDGTLVFRWVDHEDWPASMTIDGGFTATTFVPSSFSPGPYHVGAECRRDESPSISWEAADFQVVVPSVVSGPRVVLEPENAQPEDEVTASITGTCDGPVTVEWADDALTWPEPAVASGAGFLATATVPRTFAPGTHVVGASCDGVDLPDYQWPPASLEVTMAPVQLDPMSGRPGDSVRAEVTGGCDGTVIFSWAGLSEAWPASVPDGDGGFTATTRVPAIFGSGTYEIAARCEGTEGFSWPGSSFRVAAVVDDTAEALELTPATGPAGTPVTARATGYECTTVLFTWQEDGSGVTGAVDDQGIATVTTAVPADATAPSTRTLEARCLSGTDPSSHDFAVTLASAAEERLSLSADAGTRGATLLARARGFECSRVRFRWAGHGFAGSAAVRATGVAVATVEVPAGAGTGDRLRLVATCDPPDRQRASTAFRVEQPAPASYWWIPPAAFALLLLPVARAFRIRRDRAWLRQRVRVRAGPEPDASWRTAVEREDPTRPDVDVRIVPRPDRGTQGIEEVDP